MFSHVFWPLFSLVKIVLKVQRPQAHILIQGSLFNRRLLLVRSCQRRHKCILRRPWEQKRGFWPFFTLYLCFRKQSPSFVNRDSTFGTFRFVYYLFSAASSVRKFISYLVNNPLSLRIFSYKHFVWCLVLCLLIPQF